MPRSPISTVEREKRVVARFQSCANSGSPRSLARPDKSDERYDRCFGGGLRSHVAQLTRANTGWSHRKKRPGCAARVSGGPEASFSWTPLHIRYICNAQALAAAATRIAIYAPVVLHLSVFLSLSHLPAQLDTMMERPRVGAQCKPLAQFTREKKFAPSVLSACPILVFQLSLLKFRCLVIAIADCF
jgi:hypothetical protein